MALYRRLGRECGIFGGKRIARHLLGRHALVLGILEVRGIAVRRIVGRQVNHLRAHWEQRVATLRRPLHADKLRTHRKGAKQHKYSQQALQSHSNHLTWKSRTLSSPIYPLR